MAPRALGLLVASALCACGHPFALANVERSPVLEDSAPPVLELRPGPGSLDAHVEFEAPEARRRWRVRVLSDHVLEIMANGRAKDPAPWSKCAVVTERDRADLSIGALDAGTWTVRLVVDGVPVTSDEIEIPPGSAATADVAKRGAATGERGC